MMAPPWSCAEVNLHPCRARPNCLILTDTQQQRAAARRMLPAGHRRLPLNSQIWAHLKVTAPAEFSRSAFHFRSCTYTAMMKSWCWQLHQTAGSQATGFLESSSDDMLLVMDTQQCELAGGLAYGRYEAIGKWIK